VLRANATALSALEIPRISFGKQKLACASVCFIFWSNETQVGQTQHAGNVSVVYGIEAAVAIDFERKNSAKVWVVNDTVFPHCAFDFASQIPSGINELFIATTRVLKNNGLIVS
jgi:hypothetical protein